MKKTILILAGVLALLLMPSCRKSANVAGPLVKPASVLFPRADYEVDLAKGLDVLFDWETSATGTVVYQVLFDKADGDFSKPVYVLSSDNNGFKPSLTLPATTLTVIAKLAGCTPGIPAPVRWTVRTYQGADYVDGVQNGEIRNLMVIRANTIDPFPTTVQLKGTATEEGAAIPMNAALKIGQKKGDLQTDRVRGAMECFTRLSAGQYTVTDDLGRTFELMEGGKIICHEEDEAVNENTAEGVYWIYMDFNTMSWSSKEVAAVELWTHPWKLAEEDTAPLTYAGGGVWNLTDYPWVVSGDGVNDTRYHFNVTFADGYHERWAYWDDDCRESGNPDANPIFMNIYRFADGNWTDAWAHSWKTKGDSEGVDKLATFNLYMNNVHAADYVHTHTFKDK